MTELRETILQLVQAAAAEINVDLEEPIALELGEEAPLYGRDGVLDSLSLVSLVLLVEEKTSDHTGKPLSLTNERALSQFRSPFRTIGTLADYVTAQAA